MSINFPNSPSLNDTFVISNTTYTWNGTAWVANIDNISITGTPANNQLAIWTNDTTVEGSSDLTWDGATLTVTGDISVSGTVDGRDIANDGTKLDGIASGAQVNTVDKVGTPADNQIGVWTGDGTIEGDSNLTWDGSVLTVGNTGAVQLPVGTTAQQPTGVDGMIRYNSDDDAVESYYNNNWRRMAVTDLIQPDYGIINGAMQIWQRGTSSAAQGVVAADRWSNSHQGGTVTISLQNFTLGDKLGRNAPKHYLRQTVSGHTLSSHYAIVEQYIEDVRSYAGETITLLGWFKRNSGSGNVAVEFAQVFGTGGTPSTDVAGIGVTTLIPTSSWQPFAVTVDVPDITGKTLGTDVNSSALAVILWQSGGSDFNARTNSLGLQTIEMDYWGLHILPGEHGTDAVEYYRPPNITNEFIRCQRYFQQFEYRARFQSVGAGASDGRIFPLPTAMRKTPSVTSVTFVSVNVASAGFVAGTSALKYWADISPAAAGGTDWQGLLKFDAEY